MGAMTIMATMGNVPYAHVLSLPHTLCHILGLSVDGGCGGGLLLALVTQVLGDVRGRVGALELGLLAVRLYLGVLRRLLLGRGRGCLGHAHLRGVQVHPVGRGVVVPVRASHCVQKLDQEKESKCEGATNALNCLQFYRKAYTK